MPEKLTQAEINKQVEEHIKLLKEVKTLSDEDLESKDKVYKADARAALAMVTRLNNSREEFELNKKLLKQRLEEKDLKAGEKEDIERQIDLIGKLQKASKTYHKGIAEAAQNTADLQTKLVKAIAEVAQKGEKELERVSKNVPERTEAAWVDSFDVIGGGIQGMGRILGETFSHPALLAGGVLGFKNLHLGLKGFLGLIQDMPAQIDKNFHNVMKETGLSSEILYDSMTYMLDPLYAQRNEGLFKGLVDDAKPLANIGLDAKDIGTAMSTLIKDASLFRPAFIQNNKEASIFVGNLVAGLQKIGVPMATTAKNLDTFTKAMQLTPMQAAKSVKSLVSISDSLGVEAGKVAQNFEKIAPDIVQFGDRSIEVFAKLQAQAAATGLEVSRLANYAKGLDTFEGAADKAQMLNAVLGDTFLSVTDLVHADFPDKISMIQDAMANAGIDFETADRRMKQVIANAAGFESVGEAAKFLTNKEAAEEFADSVDSTAYSQEDLKARVNEGMTAAEKMTKTMSSLAGGVTKFNTRIHAAADDISGALVGTFADVASSTGDSEKALAGVVLSLQGINTLASAGTTVVGGYMGKLGMTGPAAGRLTTVLGLLKNSKVAAGLATLGAGGVVGLGLSGVELEGKPPPSIARELPVGAGGRSLADVITAVDNLSAKLENQKINVEVVSKLDGKEVGKNVAPVVIELHKNQAEREHHEMMGQ